VDPITPPANIKAEAVPQGVRVSWTVGTRPGLRFRIVKQAGKEETVAEGEGDSWIDTATEYGKTYRYLVQAVTPEKAESEIAGPVEVTPLDTFAPAVPRGLTALASATAIELSWEPNAEPDFKTYRVYRAPAGGEMTALAEITLPAATDKNVEAGKTYRYAVSAVDVKGNESARSEPAESTLP
jgi:fibronectin type 3 domain-containing protein